MARSSNAMTSTWPWNVAGTLHRPITSFCAVTTAGNTISSRINAVMPADVRHVNAAPINCTGPSGTIVICTLIWSLVRCAASKRTAAVGRGGSANTTVPRTLPGRISASSTVSCCPSGMVNATVWVEGSAAGTMGTVWWLPSGKRTSRSHGAGTVSPPPGTVISRVNATMSGWPGSCFQVGECASKRTCSTSVTGTGIDSGRARMMRRWESGDMPTMVSPT